MSRYDVIIPIRNNLPKVQETLRTLKETAYDKINRVILVDDCSDEQVSDWLYKFAVDCTNVVYIRHNVQMWFSRTANDGICLARTEWVFLLNSDLSLTQGWVEALEQARDTARAVPAVVGCKQVDGNGTTVHTGYIGHGDMAAVGAIPYEVDWCSASVWLLHYPTWLRLGGLDEKLNPPYGHFESDRDFCLRAKLVGCPIVCSPHTIVHYWRSSTPSYVTHT